MKSVYDGLVIASKSDVESQLDSGDQLDDFDVLVSVCPGGFVDPPVDEYHHFNMADGEYGYRGVNDIGMVERAVSVVYMALKHENDVLIHCESAQSRSVVVSLIAIAWMESWAYERANEYLTAEYPRANIEPSLQDFAVQLCDSGA